ncbi:MAG: protein phosphatase 2C domain-containing protein [Lachnospiraceae bacterium]|nr:protein phosphatase 2C domain-containing protein [Lachnospiraceae bacterium]
MGKVSTYGYSDPGGRHENEDNGGIYVYSKNLIAVVADGLGGQGDGDIASALALGQLSRCGEGGQLPGQEMMEQYFRRANQAILDRQKNESHMKTTAVYLCICRGRAVWAHIGDSRLYHFYEDRLCDYTLDHSVSQVAVYLGEIERKDIPRHGGRSQLLRALGCEEIQPEFHEPVELSPGRHAFLLCTDGFWEYLQDEEMENALARAGTAEEWVRSLRGTAQKRFAPDNDNNTAMAVIMEV